MSVRDDLILTLSEMGDDDYDHIADAILARFDVTEKKTATRSRVYGPFSNTQTGYLIEHSVEGWRRVWVEPGEDDDEGPWCSSEAEALREAADDWESSGTRMPQMLTTLRSLATKAERSNTA